ncbi:NAD(P)/FAD-dependent oxidoreductase [Oceaniglobus indicus]|uniref:NAD(P)/FAD-dependent oxidoreductase n=1 Tax=Oceaniglobus indicus TaxID=2047749 RepID=UPI000C18E598|nr:FAD-dependent oxidoreductase [Oceaniglobus indicus]
MTRTAVIGRGLFGAAAARHLARAGVDVTLIGPSEPADTASHRGVFGSHYDEGRITRKNAAHPFWVEASMASIARYAEIEAESGIRFYTETGAMIAGSAAFMARVDVGRRRFDVPCDRLDDAALASRFPFFRFPEHFSGFHERTRAGHISPRRLVAAQTKAAQGHGARIIDATVQGLDESGTAATVTTDSAVQSFDRVLVAAGGWSDSVLARAPRLEVYARTVALFEISDGEAARLATMPSLVYEAPEDPYLLPPVRYPDGRICVKLGGDPEDVKLDGPGAVGDWFRSGGNAQVRDRLHEMVRDLMPDLVIESVSMAACVTSWTHDRLPEIANLSDRIAVCTGGNGSGAKCSDELGRRGAALILEKTGELT